MKTQKEYIDILNNNRDELQNTFKVRHMRLFGSVARNEQSANSDVDVYVEMPPKLFMLIQLKNFLEKILGSSVDIVRGHNNINKFLKSEIDKDGITIFG